MIEENLCSKFTELYSGMFIVTIWQNTKFLTYGKFVLNLHIYVLLLPEDGKVVWLRIFLLLFGKYVIWSELLEKYCIFQLKTRWCTFQSSYILKFPYFSISKKAILIYVRILNTFLFFTQINDLVKNTTFLLLEDYF